MGVAAVIPAYNEEKTVADVVRVVVASPLVNRVLVVSDGSVDNTATMARAAGAEVIELPENRGKGAALKVGIDSSTEEILLFLDADLIGLTETHVSALLEPVLNGSAQMSIGIFTQGRVATDLAQAVAPYLSGQRAVRRTLLENISDLEMTRFGVEVALTQYSRKFGVRSAEVVLPDLTHHMKEEKLGVWKGLTARFKMYWEIAAYLTEELVNPPRQGRG